MKILVIGGTGFISAAITRQASNAGHGVVLFNRGLSDPNARYAAIRGDVNNLLSFKKQLLDQKPDVVVHSVSYTEQHAKDLVTVFEGTKTHVIVLGSGDCYEAFWQLNHGEDGSDYPVREDSQLCKTKHYWKEFASHRGGKDYDKNLMTDVLMAAHRQGKITPTVFRLPMVYGPEDDQYAGRHGKIIKYIVDNKMDMVMSGTEQATIFTYGYVENVAAAIVHSFGLQQTIGQIYNLGDSEVRTQRRWADLYAENAGRKFSYHILPPEVLGGDSALNEVPQNFILDTSKFRKDTGFVEPISLKEAIKKTYEWAVQNPQVLKGVAINYDSAKAAADLYQDYIRAFNQKLKTPSPLQP